MATIITCDGGCGAHSPDYSVRRGGPHVANGWLRVRAEKRLRFDEGGEHSDKLFCESCEPRILAALKPIQPANPPTSGEG